METKGQILTINPNGVFIDNVPTTQYNGYDIRGVEKYARGLVGGILEIQVMQSNLEGNLVGLPGNPIPNAYGRYTWMCAKTDDNIWSDWLFRANYGIGDKGKKMLAENIVIDTFILASPRRDDLRKAVIANIEAKKAELLGMDVAAKKKAYTK